MKKLHSFIKHLVAILLGTALVGMSVYAVQIPTSLNNALQYIMETIWTSDGTASGTTNVQIWTGGIYIATGFLQNGNAWNNMSLGLDTSGNVVYVPGSSSTPIFSLASNFIPKLDSLGSALEISVMYQSGWLIWVNKTNPTRSVNILGDFLVETQGLNVTYQYNFLNSNTGLWYPAVDINTSPRCSCDINATTADCNSPSFSSLTDQGFYCVDLTVLNNGNNYDHNVYTRQTIGIPSAVLSTSGANVWVGTDDPQTSFHVEGGAVLFNGNTGTIPDLWTGTRFAWIPSKAALRIWFVDGPWRDDMYIGVYSNVLWWYNNISFSGSYAVIGWGSGNFAGNGLGHVVVGWEGNNASSAIFTDNYVFIGGWYFNSASAGNGLTLVGWYNNSISKPFLGGTQPHYATLVGWFDNEIYNGPLWFIGGWSGNYVEWTASSILGGEWNTIFGAYNTIAWGNNNTIPAWSSQSTIGWWSGNSISGIVATIGWGSWNYALGYGSTVWGWVANAATW